MGGGSVGAAVLSSGREDVSQRGLGQTGAGVGGFGGAGP